MSVIMTLWIQGDARKVEEVARADPGRMRSILETAKEHGLIAHRFYGSPAGDQVLVIDEWPDPESFQAFFEAAGDRIGSLMQEAGVTAEPRPAFWSKLDVGDDYGWGAEDR